MSIKVKDWFLSNIWSSVTVLAFDLGNYNDKIKRYEYSIDCNCNGGSSMLGISMDIPFDDVELSLCDLFSPIFSSSSACLLILIDAIDVARFRICVFVIIFVLLLLFVPVSV